MIMRIKLECGCCVANVYRAVGIFLSEDIGPSTIRAVDAFHAGEDSEGAVVTWDVLPSRRQIAEFRRVWDAETNKTDVTILHDAPSSIADVPSLKAEEA